eukprot:TRINITY_DN3752_c0_g1_i1.p1 TRINITY_DN3752_c0_g1~~TRINITY_DN3752_c0_g1_i1.p1  ORF type:complete len:134 (+),score=6.14 TRINITY_DN3752_c0_g1_i1:425-826(+)
MTLNKRTIGCALGRLPSLSSSVPYIYWYHNLPLLLLGIMKKEKSRYSCRFICSQTTLKGFLFFVVIIWRYHESRHHPPGCFSTKYSDHSNAVLGSSSVDLLLFFFFHYFCIYEHMIVLGCRFFDNVLIDDATV